MLNNNNGRTTTEGLWRWVRMAEEKYDLEKKNLFRSFALVICANTRVLKTEGGKHVFVLAIIFPFFFF